MTVLRKKKSMTESAPFTLPRFGALALSMSLAGCGSYAARPDMDQQATTTGQGTAGTGATTATPQAGAAATGDVGVAGAPGTAGATGGAPGTGGTPGAAGTSEGGTSSSTAGAAGAVSTAGAGGSGTPVREVPPEASCEDVTACGGDASGVWFATSACLPISGIADLGGLGIGCEEAPASGELDVTGNWTVGADGTFSDNTTTTGEVKLELEPECLDVSGTVTTCDRVGAPLASAGFTTVTCVDSETTEGGCTCTCTVDQSGGTAYVSFNATTEGTHASADNTFTVSGIDDIDYSYCVDGNFMMVTPTTTNIIGTTNGTVVFQKQP